MKHNNAIQQTAFKKENEQNINKKIRKKEKRKETITNNKKKN